MPCEHQGEAMRAPEGMPYGHLGNLDSPVGQVMVQLLFGTTSNSTPYHSENGRLVGHMHIFQAEKKCGIVRSVRLCTLFSWTD